ncbi:MULTISPECIES: hypothetical protein [unclassified Ruegeria]|uniref:hypothetical protein n=1 Tax=unclassified Ruegeria TaxID=2625375 RepID=UPI00148820C3|nr:MULTISPECIES: hypothetical protein [unclassified Ruegeria]NOD36068.1 hypothetical protein [Ruegeria sp. HKCCD7296]NOD45788.1 hypothetical protein [Ruegeria sp. HKCCD5849]NOD50912.1 hypothetical protein [Ruegeria sp. HKCCD5851]NOD67719.1 hypothetical protein [Ruegeria sp. HKCCD7303]NOE35638.1 hypothetical protein [Ruegeria sp. HKCCD7318]
MKLLPILSFILLCAGCADFPELEGSEPASVKKAPYPRLVPLQETLGPAIDPVSQAATVEEDLTQRSEALAQKAQALQNAQTN